MLLDWGRHLENHCSRTLLLKVWPRPAAEASPGSLLETQDQRPPQSLLNQSLPCDSYACYSLRMTLLLKLLLACFHCVLEARRKGKTSLLSRKQTLGGAMTTWPKCTGPASVLYPDSECLQRKPLLRQGMGGAREARMGLITLAWL